MAEELKQLPEGGTRKRYKDLMFVLATTVATVIIAAILLGVFTIPKDNAVPAEFTMIMEILAWWAVLSGSLFGLYSLSENGAKQSFAVLNKNR